MAYELFQETPANVQFAADGGYGTECWFREISKFSSIAEAPDVAVDEGDTRVITDSHTFSGSEGFIKGSGHQEGGKVDGASVGEAGFMGQPSYKFTIFFVGDQAALRERMENLKNRGFILLFKDPNCQDTRILQLGCQCDPALISEMKYESGERKKGGKKGYTVTFESTCLFDYQGLVTEKGTSALSAPVLSYVSPNLSWPSTGDNRYKIELDNDNTFPAPIVFYTTLSSYSLADVLAFLAADDYYVRVSNTHAATTPSNTITFTV